MIKYVIGALGGGLFGYFVLYKLIGCWTGSCPITKSPIVSTVVGILLGVLIAFAVPPTAKPAENNTITSSAQSIAAPENSTESSANSSLSVAQSVVASENSAESKPIISSSTPNAAAIYRKISAQDAKARIDSEDKIIILDVRTEAEFAARHIPNAILIPNETIIDTKPELLSDLNAEILVYCRSGNRSAQAASKLISIGYTNVYDFGGIIDWPYETVTGE